MCNCCIAIKCNFLLYQAERHFKADIPFLLVKKSYHYVVVFKNYRVGLGFHTILLRSQEIQNVWVCLPLTGGRQQTLNLFMYKDTRERRFHSTHKNVFCMQTSLTSESA
uniref:Uncharacterized protein orf108 n=1 Tax=Chlorokybus atmophyticus TaxID=3144 RepID=A6YE88_CHLAT|nr:hypothetical protein Chatpmp16 [Chlorokybus atmophyticus]ABO15145.1 hypothetical protein [Chlorokybus atmophyticus]